ncbi:MAG: histidine kinase dimerization/phospho-acceptor domain-containing protein [Rhodospirillaceae bacterium]|nr:histidine kinase dimerization/phospho-acceptor domain-containing protein [Rhodospirillaceae bacterium]
MAEVIPTIPTSTITRIGERRTGRRTASLARDAADAEGDDMLAAALAALPTAVAIVDTAGRMVSRNPAFAALTGTVAPPGSAFDRLFHFADQPTVRQMLQQARFTQAACMVGLVDLRRIELIAQRLDRPGRRTLIVVHLTPPRAAPVEAERLAIMNHDLRTPLNAIMGFAEMIQRDALGQGVAERYRDYAEDIVGAAALMLRTVEKLVRAASDDAAGSTGRPH